MKEKFIFYFTLLSLTIFACRQNSNMTYDYTSLSVDTSNTIIFKWDGTLYTFTNFSEPLALSNDDIKLADSLLNDAVDKFNKTNSKGLYQAFNKQVPIDSFIIDLSKYKRQFFPYRDVNGQRVFYLVCFSKTFPEWRNKIYHGGLHYGITKFTLRVNLSDRKADELSTGSYG